MREWHRPRIQALVEAGVDLLALETIPCQEEAEMLCDLLRDYPTIKAWLSFSCKVTVTFRYTSRVSTNKSVSCNVKAKVNISELYTAQ